MQSEDSTQFTSLSPLQQLVKALIAQNMNPKLLEMVAKLYPPFAELLKLTDDPAKLHQAFEFVYHKVGEALNYDHAGGIGEPECFSDNVDKGSADAGTSIRSGDDGDGKVDPVGSPDVGVPEGVSGDQGSDNRHETPVPSKDGNKWDYYHRQQEILQMGNGNKTAP